jgi:SNF2 family DNA or RNA helicase
MIRRLQKDTLKAFLPPRSETLLFCRPSAEQCRLYKELTTGSISDSLSTLTKLRKLCSHPDLLNGPSVGATSSQDASNCTNAGKLDVLEGLLSAIRSENPTDKVIVVSNFTSALTVIDDYILKRKGWTSVRLDGTTEQSTRQTLVDSFNRSSADNGFVFLLSSKAGGCGLNLIGGKFVFVKKKECVYTQLEAHVLLH